MKMMKCILMWMLPVVAWSQNDGTALRSQNKIVDKLELSEISPDPYYEDQVAVIRYRAIDAYSFSVIIFNELGKQVLTFDRLKRDNGQVKIPARQLAPGRYKYALCVNGRMVFRKDLVVMRLTSRHSESSAQ